MSDDVVKKVRAHVARLCREKGLDTALAVGKYVVTHLLDGDASKLHGKEHPSIRELAALLEDDHVVSSTTLWRYLGVYSLSVRRKDAFEKGLDYGTAMELVGLSVPAQDEILDTPNATAAGMEAAARAKRPKRKPPAPDIAAERQVKKAAAVLAGLAALPKAERVSRVKQLEPLMKQIVDSWEAVTGKAKVKGSASPPVEELPPEPEAVAAEPVAEPAPVAAEPEGVPEPAPAAPEPTPPEASSPVLGERPSLLTDEPYHPVRMGRAVHFGFHAPITGQPWPLKSIPGLAGSLADAAKQEHLHLRFAPTVQGLLRLCRVASALPYEWELVGRTSVALDGEVLPFRGLVDPLRQLWEAYGQGETAWISRVRYRGGQAELPPLLRALGDEWLGELPRPGSGLSTTEAALLDLAEAGATLAVARACNPGVYDEATTERLLRDLAAAGALTIGADALAITDLGRQLKGGKEDYLRHRVGDRWWGKVQVPSTCAYRYDPGSRKLIGG